ncbi:MAG: hypothetical protein RJA03_164, partial [Pseudomonadota bacterium]
NLPVLKKSDCESDWKDASEIQAVSSLPRHTHAHH